jgi:hypothetical protein
LLTVDVFRQVAVEEGVLDVELVYRPVAHWRDAARWSTVWMDVSLTTGDNVWWKSTPSRCKKPRAHNPPSLAPLQ